jgi:cbb3-type cytochrome oxidase cytochrome c subunit
MPELRRGYPAILRSRRWLVVVLTIAFCPEAASRARGQSSKSAAVHPVVAGFERFYTTANADLVRGGQLLLGELNCISCHRPEITQESYLFHPPGKPGAIYRGPVLDAVGARVKRSYLRKFLADPQAVKPGTTMPHLLAGITESDRKEKVEALVHFLATTGSPRQDRPQKKLVALGRDLYHRSGCVACHGSRDVAANADKLLPSSVPLGDLKTKYTLGSLSAFLESPHLARPAARMPGLLKAKEAREVANFLLQGLPYEGPPPNLAFAYYQGNWGQVPDFDKLKPTATGQAEGFDLSVALRNHDFGLKFDGYLKIERAGDYRFHLSSDDGSKLYLDGKLVVANDGIHPTTTTSGMANLSQGMHKLTIGFFNAGGEFELRLEIEGPRLRRQDAAPFVYLTPQGNPVPVVKKQEPKEEESFPIQPALADKGRQLFASLGCASCHQLKIDNKEIESKRTAPGLAKLRAEGGCLEKAREGIPQYPFSPAQRAALTAALRAPTPAGKPDSEELIARTLVTFNCYACHERRKVGGPEEALNLFFTTTQPEMGDEGRIPPSLDGVGNKLKSDYLRKILDQGSHDRPYMHTRMPAFRNANVGHLVDAFAAVDKREPVAKVLFTEQITQIKAQGRHMVGAQSLGCIKCHTFAGHKAEGVQGMDMTLLTHRLERDWFHRYVLDPQKIRPGTRMPTAWFQGNSPLPKVLGGDTAKQIEAIWVYLSDGNQARLPVGLKQQFLPLIPEKEAIVYRNFIAGAGTRGIAVGYPEKVNLAFDANDLRLAMLWQGAFIDAARHWTDRGAGFEPPLGDNILNLPAGPSLAVLAKEEQPWPNKSAKELGFRFQGYRLTADQRPTFLYSFNGVNVEDFPNAVTRKSNPAILRKLTLSGPNTQNNLWFRAAVADKIEPLADGWYRINGEWRMRIEAAAAPRLRRVGGKTELLVPVHFQDGRTQIVQEFVW